MADEEKAAEAPAKGGGGSLKWIAIAAIASIASAGATFVVVSRTALQAQKKDAAAEESAKGDHAEAEHGDSHEAAKESGGHEESGGHGGGHEESGGHDEGGHGGGGGHGDGAASSTFQLETFIVNINDGERDRFLKLKPELELSDPALTDELKSRMPQVKDTIISLLSSQSFGEIRSIEGKDTLREELLVRLNAMLKTGKVNRVYFTEFVVQ